MKKILIPVIMAAVFLAGHCCIHALPLFNAAERLQDREGEGVCGVCGYQKSRQFGCSNRDCPSKGGR